MEGRDKKGRFSRRDGAVKYNGIYLSAGREGAVRFYVGQLVDGTERGGTTGPF